MELIYNLRLITLIYILVKLITRPYNINLEIVFLLETILYNTIIFYFKNELIYLANKTQIICYLKAIDFYC